MYKNINQYHEKGKYVIAYVFGGVFISSLTGNFIMFIIGGIIGGIYGLFYRNNHLVANKLKYKDNLFSKRFIKRSENAIILASGGAFIGGIIGQITGSIIGAIAGAIFGFMNYI